ncbi:MAG TPA: diacylglycerol kinase family protein [Opitutaceae bacterium]|nr:diacylglycerol kinase family protein [Opitutaceae bacterium]HND62743.1 diacylglycerol kinase family protein [Opitutaceae bacterium]
MRRGLLVYNPAAGSSRQSRQLPRLLEILRQGGIATEPAATNHAGHATELARDAARDGSADVVFAYGGDGTVREVATGLLGSSVALGVIPGGTTNVVRIALGLPAKPEAAAARLCQLPARPIDVGLCNGRPFLMQASVGSAAHIMAHIQGSWLKARLGRAGVVAAGLPAWLGYGFPEITVEIDGEPVRAFGITACNISEIAGPYRIVPEGRHDDRQLELALFHGRGRRAETSFTLDLYRKRHTRRADFAIRPMTVARILGPAGIALQIDGDAIPAELPVEIRLAPQRLQVLADPGTPGFVKPASANAHSAER